MLITCDNNIKMGYIYLMPKSNTEYSLADSDIRYYYDLNDLSIPLLKGSGLGRRLGTLSLSKKTYSEAVDTEFHCAYWNDLNEEGYMVGIELALWEERFLTLVGHQAFKIYDTRWRNQDLRVLTLDAHLEVIKKSNVIYPLTPQKDTFVVLDIDKETKVCMAKALMTSREDLYPQEYLRQPLFMLSNSKKYFAHCD